MKTLILLWIGLAGGAAMAPAQTKVSGTGKCGQPDAQQSIEVGDRAGHMLEIVKQSCTFATPLEMDGLKSVSYTVAIAADARGTKSQDHAYVVAHRRRARRAVLQPQSVRAVRAI